MHQLYTITLKSLTADQFAQLLTVEGLEINTVRVSEHEDKKKRRTHTVDVGQTYAVAKGVSPSNGQPLLVVQALVKERTIGKICWTRSEIYRIIGDRTEIKAGSATSVVSQLIKTGALIRYTEPVK